MNRSKYKILTELLIAAGIVFVTIIITQGYLFTLRPFAQLELKLLDERFRRRGERKIEKESEIVVIEITQDTYDQIPPPYNSWPWPRVYYAKLIENLNEAGAKAIGIDIVLSTKDKYSEENDLALKDVLNKYDNIVLAGKLDPRLESEFEIVERGESDGKINSIMKKRNQMYGNLFYSPKNQIGIVLVGSDYDGVYRRYSPYVYSGVNNELIPTFGFSLLNIYYGLEHYTLAENTPDKFILGKKEIPKYDNTSMLVNFYGVDTYKSFKHFKFIDIIDDKDFKTIDEIEFETDINTWDDPEYGLKNKGFFKDKIVLIGSTMPEDKDVLPVSFARGVRKGDNMMYGVEFHATALQNIIDDDYILASSEIVEFISVVIVVFFSFFGTSLLRNHKISNNFVTEILSFLSVILVLYLLNEFSIYLFVEHKYLLAMIPPGFGLLIGYFGSTAYHFIRERKESRQIKKMFSHYVSGEVVEELVDNPDKLTLGGENRELSILFSDIAGFSSFSQDMTPEELVSFMNEYLNAMTNIVMRNNGTLDKYIGDAVMAFWGAPVSLKDHAFRACKTAIEMRDKLIEMKAAWREQNLPDINVRIGVNTGEVIVGNIGSEKRFDYTAMGDDVNLASRLEGANKQYGTYLMISDSTYKQVRDKFFVRELDTIRVKGRTIPTTVYELLGFIDDEAAGEYFEKLNHYSDALACFRNRKFADAEKCFLKSLEKLPGDLPSKIYLKRTQIYKENPPDAEWDGVFTMKTK